MFYLDLHDDKPSEQMLSSVYNTDSGVCEEIDRMIRQQLNASAKYAVYTFDHGTKPLLRKKLS